MQSSGPDCLLHLGKREQIELIGCRFHGTVVRISVQRQLSDIRCTTTRRVNQGSPPVFYRNRPDGPVLAGGRIVWDIRARVPWLRYHLEKCAMTEAVNVVSFLFLGFFLGMRHATDADHVVAIATIVSRERSIAGSALIGAAWGIGHTMTVMAVGAAIIVFGIVIPPKLGLSMEFAVGIMLVLLGILTLTGVGRAVGAAHAHANSPGGHAHALHDHLHAHGDYVHMHPHGHDPDAHGHAEDQTPLARLDH